MGGSVKILRRPGNAAAAGDPIPFFRNGETHLFYLSSPLGTLDYPKRVRTSWQHVHTTDFTDWQVLTPALEPGEASAYDAGGIWTGSVVESVGTYYLFYTAHHVGAPNPQTICLATSTDLVHFERSGANPLVTPTAGYEPVDWRDPYVFYNDAEQRWWMLIAARLERGPKWRRGCVVLATSENLWDWSVEPEPLYVPGTTYCPECPEMWAADGRWYLIFSRFSEDVGTIYRVADSPRGPFRVPAHDALGGRRWYAAKSAPSTDGARVFFGWVHDFVAEGRPRWLWGGDFAAPRVVTPDADGELSVRLHPAFEAMFADGSATATKLEAIGGEAHATAIDVLPGTCLIRAQFTVADNPAAFGLALAENDDLEGWFVTFDRKRGFVTLAREPQPLDDFWADLTGRSAAHRNVDGPIVDEAPYSTESGGHALTLLLDGEIIEVYIDARRALTHRIARTAALRAVAFAVDGRAEVNVRVSKQC
jgi:beta-fructofuranosidase